MSSDLQIKRQDGALPQQPSKGTEGKSGGRKYCSDPNKMIGTLFAILAAITLIFACVLGAGVFGGGQMGLIAGGLTIGSMILAGVASYSLLVVKEKKTAGNPDFLKI